jgi:chromosome segregation protein
MYLKSITLKGFKSFPERTRLEFGPGVSVVVGPNGSGKSNVTDAVLWALGEQSPVAVRGQSMQDVIFAGAPGRQASRTAEVELVLDDSEGSLGLGSEVSIVRRLDRSGEGEYRLAGARCRLVDVIETVSDTGLGKEMHSVISQGRVESIVTSKPRDRRLLIEEAAGLGKHRKRRRRAQLKLARTQDNLDRALDVEREARTRLRPLKRQAEAAELHARLERQALELRWQLARDDLRAHLSALAQAEARAAQARSGREHLERDLRAVATRREAAEEALASRSAQREELSRRCFVARSAAERVSYRTDGVRAAADSIATRCEHGRRLLAALESEAAEEAPDTGSAERIAELEASLAELEHERERALARQLADLEHRLAGATAAVAARQEVADQVASEREQAETALEQARRDLHEGERAVEAARREAARIGGELAAVNQFLRGQPTGSDAAPMLADQLQVQPGYELALAAALDGRLGAAVVADRPTGAALLDRAGTDGGRTLVARASGSHPESPSGAAPMPGARLLADFLSGPANTVSLARALLHDTWVLETLEGLPEAFTGVAVTRSGRVWSAHTRELRQAPAVGEDRILTERNRREQLIRATEQAATAEGAAASALELSMAAYQAAESERERASFRLRGAVGEREEAEEEQRRIAAAIGRRRDAPDEGPNEGLRRQLAAELAALKAAASQLERDRAQREAQIEHLRSAIARDAALVPSVRATAETLQTAHAAISSQQASFEAALVADREAGEHVAAELRACAQEEAALQTKLHGSSEALTQAEVELHRARDRASESEQELAGLGTRLELEASPAEEALPEQEREALTGRLERLARRRELLGPVNPLAEQEYAEALAHVEELEHQRSDLETALAELEKLIADTDRQIRETFEQTFEAAARNFEAVAEQLFPGGHGRLRLVAETDGPARVLGGSAPTDDDASEEADEPEDRELAAEDEQLLGVEIEINPAGKEMKRLTLLSGGEKSMTALAFLFAVFLARPCPFYILDEVEAALDDLNIDRFLGLLRAYSNHAQFIVVTHQRRTMEAADFLYGVSMGGDGVSKVISRRLPREEAAA